jgi:hypothetical protein
MRGYVDKVRMRHAESASIRNQHKGLERRWFEQCAYFCTLSFPEADYERPPVASRRLLFLGSSGVSDFRRFIRRAAYTFPAIDPKIALERSLYVWSARQFPSGVKILFPDAGVA